MSLRAMCYHSTIAVLMSLVASHGSWADLIISEFSLAADQVELVNVGSEVVNIAAYSWCNRVNGSPFYDTVANVSTIEPSLSTSGGFTMSPGDVLVVSLDSPFLPDSNGELGLYSAALFSEPTALVDYVLWGFDGVRDSVAEAAGLWIDNDAIDTSSLGPGETVQLDRNRPGDAASDYILAPDTLGLAQSIPEPSPFFCGLALLFLRMGLGRLSRARGSKREPSDTHAAGARSNAREFLSAAGGGSRFD